MLARDVEHADDHHDALYDIPEVRPLLPALRENPQGLVRNAADHLAERFGDMSFADRLRMLEDDHGHVRQGAALKFVFLVRDRELTLAEEDMLRVYLGRRLDDSDEYVRRWAAEALADMERLG